MPRPRSASEPSPKERVPRAQHKNSPSNVSSPSSSSPTSSPNKNGSLNIHLPPLRSSESDCGSQRSLHRDDCHLSRSGSFNNVLAGGGGEKCVCFICTCGKHHCPPAYKPNPTPLDATTHYTDTYKTHEMGSYPERVVVNQSYVGTRAAPGHFDTTHKANFTPIDPTQHAQNYAERMDRYRPNNQRTSPRSTFDHTTAHRSDFPWHNPSPAVPIRPAAESPISAGPFYGNTTAKDTYVEWKADPDAFQRSSHSKRNSSHSPFSNDPADFSTSYTGQYVEHGLSQRAPPKPKASYNYGSPRSFHTSHQLEYTGKQNPQCPAHLLPARPASARSGHVKYRLDTTGTWA